MKLKGIKLIDTIKIVSYKHNLCNYNPPIELQQSTEFFPTGNPSHKFSSKNMVLYLTNNKLTIQGSLTKYLLGHNINFKLGSNKDVKDAFDLLSEDLSLKLDDFMITRIDFGKCFIVDKLIGTYLNGLISLKEHSWTQYGNTGKDFHNTVRRVKFYDKNKQLETLSKQEKESNKRLIQLLDLEEESILRYEIQIQKPVIHYNRKIRVKDILDKDNYFSMVLSPYFTLFRDIEKGSNIDTIDFAGKKPKDLANISSLYGIIKYGESRFISGIKQLKKSDPSERRKYDYYLIKIKDLKRKYSFSSNYLDELEKEIWESIHQPAAMPGINLIVTDKAKLYNFILTKVKLLRKKKPDLNLKGVLSTWKSLRLDKSLNNDVIALHIVKEIQTIKEISKPVNGMDKIIRENAYTNAVDIMKSKSIDKYTRKNFADITLVDFLNMIARRCNLKT